MKWRFYLGIVLFCLKHHKSKARGRKSLLKKNPWLIEPMTDVLSWKAWKNYVNQLQNDGYLSGLRTSRQARLP